MRSTRSLQGQGLWLEQMNFAGTARQGLLTAAA
jgi:hypothetical protein